MYETPDEVAELQALLDRSYEGAGPHLRSIFTPERRIGAAELVDLLPGMQVLSLATVTASGEPRVSPVDGLFFHGRFWFGSSPDSARFRHLRARPAVSATHHRGEELAVVVHGSATIVDLADPAMADFRGHCIEVYGDGWNEWGAAAPYARIEPSVMFTARFTDVAGS
jgi:hypothetical protein